MQPLRLNARFNTRDVVIEDDVTGITYHYQLREIVAKEREQYQNELVSRSKFNDNGQWTGIQNFIGWQPSLLKRTMFKVREMKGDTIVKEYNPPVLVPEDELKTWRASLLEILFEAAQELNALGKENPGQLEADAKKG